MTFRECHALPIIIPDVEAVQNAATNTTMKASQFLAYRPLTGGRVDRTAKGDASRQLSQCFENRRPQLSREIRSAQRGLA